MIDGVGGNQASAGGSNGAGAVAGSMSGAAGENSATGGSAGAAAGGGTGGQTDKMATVLVYADDAGDVYGSEWDGTAFRAPNLWLEAGVEVAFVEARMAPDRSWGIAAYQAGGDDACILWVQPFVGSVVEPPTELFMGDVNNCNTARSFDLAFEAQSNRALVAYAGEDGLLEYRSIERASISQAQTSEAVGSGAINWVRLVPDFAKNRISVVYSVEGMRFDSLELMEWEGESMAPPHRLATRGVLLDSQSFDAAYYQGSLVVLRGDSTGDGFGYQVRDSTGTWSEESMHDSALSGHAQNIELCSLPYGLAAVLYDAEGSQAVFGATFWQEGTFTEETQLDNGLPSASQFESATLKTDLARLGDTAIAVYSDDYEGPSGAVSGLGWAVKQADGAWQLQQSALPIPFEQESRDAVTRAVRLARFEAANEGVVLVFGEDDGVFATSLSDISAGWDEPVLIDANVSSDGSTRFSIAGPVP